jgi:hypothetical protein
MALAYGKHSPQQMLAKAERDLARFKAAEAAQKGGDELSDALFNFAVSVTSVKDWVKEQPNVAFSRDDVENYVKASPALTSFRDIANAGKHRVITKYEPTTEDTLVSATSVVALARKSEKPSQSHVSKPFFHLKIVRRDQSRHRAVELGQVAVQEWQSFMRQYGLIG